MFKKNPRILAHKAALSAGNFVTPHYIIGANNDTSVNTYKRFCPHRMYPFSEPGNIITQNIKCNFHGYEWTKEGVPLNNNRNIKCGEKAIGRTGLILEDFAEPQHKWVDDLANETGLIYSHSCHGTSAGSWLWMMEIQADLLHIRRGADSIHPVLGEATNLNSIEMYEGDGWILQTCSTGWWLFVYPYTFVEWSPGCVSINYTTPNDSNNEFGFSWITQFYYDKSVPKAKRADFETLEDVFKEDVCAIEKQRGKYFPLYTTDNRLEQHCVHWGQWVRDNRL